MPLYTWNDPKLKLLENVLKWSNNNKLKLYYLKKIECNYL